MTSSTNSVPDLEAMIREWVMDTGEMRVFIAGIPMKADKHVADIRDIEKQFRVANWSVLVQLDAHMQLELDNRIHAGRYIQYLARAVSEADLVLFWNSGDVCRTTCLPVIGLMFHHVKASFGEPVGIWQRNFDAFFATHGSLQEMLDAYSRNGYLGSRDTRLRAALAKFKV